MFILVVLVTLIMLMMPPASHAQQDLADLFDEASLSVATVLVYNRPREQIGTGSGFFVAKPEWPSGEFVTNFHVLDGGYWADIVLVDGTRAPIKDVIFSDERIDTMIVTVDLPPQQMPAGLPLASGRPRVGEPVFAIGTPLGFENTLSVGHVAQIRPLDGIPAIQLNMDIAPGNSGGPLLNMRGEVLGIVTSRIPSDIASGMSFAMFFSVESRPGFRDMVNNVLPLFDWAESHSRRRADALIDQGWQYLEEGQPRLALQWFQAAVQEDEQHERAWFGLGYAFSDMGLRGDSAEAYRRAIELHPNYASAHNNLGVELEEMGWPRDALHHYRRAVAIAPRQPLYHRNIGRIYLALGRRDLAVRSYEILQSLPDGADDASILYNLLYGN